MYFEVLKNVTEACVFLAIIQNNAKILYINELNGKLKNINLEIDNLNNTLKIDLNNILYDYKNKKLSNLELINMIS